MAFMENPSKGCLLLLTFAANSWLAELERWEAVLLLVIYVYLNFAEVDFEFFVEEVELTVVEFAADFDEDWMLHEQTFH